MFVICLALFLTAGSMAECGHGPVPKKYEFKHVRDQYEVRVVRIPENVRPSLKRSAELPRSSPRLNELPDDAEHDLYCLSAGYFMSPDVGRVTKPKTRQVLSCSKGKDMEKRLKLFGMPASFPSQSEALRYKAVYKDVVETIEDVSVEKLQDWILDKKRVDEQFAEKERCEAQRDLRKPHGCLGSLLITN